MWDIKSAGCSLLQSLHNKKALEEKYQHGCRDVISDLIQKAIKKGETTVYYGCNYNRLALLIEDLESLGYDVRKERHTNAVPGRYLEISWEGASKWD